MIHLTEQEFEDAIKAAEERGFKRGYQDGKFEGMMLMNDRFGDEISSFRTYSEKIGQQVARLINEDINRQKEFEEIKARRVEG